LRGFNAGSFNGDRLLAASAEARVLLFSPVRFVRLGTVAFVDAAKAYDAGAIPDSVPWAEGAGAGVFAISPFGRFNIYFAEPFDGGDIHTHFSFGFTF
jgi:outer membrane protein assembly factor BamA